MLMRKLLLILLLLFMPVAAYSQGASVAAFIYTSLFANLGTPPDGSVRYCTDCTPSAPCAGGGTGALAVHINGAWNCTNASTITTGNCTSSASPAVCGSASAGSVVVAAAATTVTVNTTAVTANSQIMLQFDSSLGTKLTVTCNTTEPAYSVSARTGGTSFQITVASAPVTNPACFSYHIIN